MNKPYSFNVNDEEDPDIIACLDNLPRGTLSAFIRDAIRCQMGRHAERDLSNQQVVDILLSAIKKGGVGSAPPPPPGDVAEAPEIIAALGGLGEW
jgi:hypothetical protein